MQTACMYGYPQAICESNCGCQERMERDSRDPVPIEKVSKYDRSVPMRIRIPPVRDSASQASQIIELRDRIAAFIKSSRDRSASRWFRDLADEVILDPGAVYEERRVHLEFLVNLFIRDFTLELEEIIKGA